MDRRAYDPEAVEDAYKRGRLEGAQAVIDFYKNPPLPMPSYIVTHCCDDPNNCANKDKFRNRVDEAFKGVVMSKERYNVKNNEKG